MHSKKYYFWDLHALLGSDKKFVRQRDPCRDVPWYVSTLGLLSLPLVCCLYPWFVVSTLGLLSLPLVCCLYPWFVVSTLGLLSLPLVCCLYPWFVVFTRGLWSLPDAPWGVSTTPDSRLLLLLQINCTEHVSIVQNQYKCHWILIFIL